MTAAKKEAGRTISDARNQIWFALADAEHCRLFRCSLTEFGTQHVDENGAFENTLPDQEHARPMTQGGMTHHVEEKEKRFAAEIVEWLRTKTEELKIDGFVIFAPPRMLGALRKAPLGALRGRVEELQGNLMRLEPGQLAEHQIVSDLVQAAQET